MDDVRTLTDGILIGRAILGAEAIAELDRRFPEFIVRDRDRGFVTGFYPRDGEADYTTDPNMARIFSGEEWLLFWSRPRFDFFRSAEQVRAEGITPTSPR